MLPVPFFAAESVLFSLRLTWYNNSERACCFGSDSRIACLSYKGFYRMKGFEYLSECAKEESLMTVIEKHPYLSDEERQKLALLNKQMQEAASEQELKRLTTQIALLHEKAKVREENKSN